MGPPRDGSLQDCGGTQCPTLSRAVVAIGAAAHLEGEGEGEIYHWACLMEASCV